MVFDASASIELLLPDEGKSEGFFLLALDWGILNSIGCRKIPNPAWERYALFAQRRGWLCALNSIGGCQNHRLNFVVKFYKERTLAKVEINHLSAKGNIVQRLEDLYPKLPTLFSLDLRSCTKQAVF